MTFGSPGIFPREGRCPTDGTRLIDTYWSDHCRHTTFGTILTGAEIATAYVQKSYETYLELRERLYAGRKDKPVTLMDLATIGAEGAQGGGQAARPGRIRRDQRLLCPHSGRCGRSGTGLGADV